MAAGALAVTRWYRYGMNVASGPERVDEPDLSVSTLPVKSDSLTRHAKDHRAAGLGRDGGSAAP